MHVMLGALRHNWPGKEQQGTALYPRSADGTDATPTIAVLVLYVRARIHDTSHQFSLLKHWYSDESSSLRRFG